MHRIAARAIALVGCLAALALTGCATPGSGPDGDKDALNNAIATDHVAPIRGAIQTGALTPNSSISTPGYPDGAPLLAIAARVAALEVMRFLISAGADLNARTPVHETPLMLAAFFFDESEQGPQAFDRHEKAVRLLVTSGADLENYPGYYTPLAYAAYRGNERVVRYLIERGANVNSGAGRGGAYSNTPLMMAAIQGHESIVMLLLRAGADADIRILGGHNAAELAAKYNHRRLAQIIQCAQRQYGAAGPECRQILGSAR
ncbi:MAG TPA: ankyrin repeat domain-containing protein [Burkholderiales bacterium]|nr:ankyrin repeat domain-containing protein [Burkholderiales bacterium]